MARRELPDTLRWRGQTPDEIIGEIRNIAAACDSLSERLSSPPYDADNFGLPDDLHELSNSELNDLLYRSGRMYSHYVDIESNLAGINRGMKEAVKILAASLRRQIYEDLPKDTQKDSVLMDKDYGEAHRISRDLDYLLGEAEGGKKFWSSLKDTLSRSVELRKEVGRPQNPRGPRTPKRRQRIHPALARAEEE